MIRVPERAQTLRCAGNSSVEKVGEILTASGPTFRSGCRSEKLARASCTAFSWASSSSRSRQWLRVSEPIMPALQLAMARSTPLRSEEHTSELQSLMRISYAVFCLKKQKKYKKNSNRQI